MDRKLAAILNADVEGYSRLMGDDEAATVGTINSCRDLIAGVIRDYRGRMVDFTGDNLLAEFASVVDAVQGAVAIQDALGARNAMLPEHRRMRFRIGINLGDVIVDGERLYGDGVNVAARVQALAEGGGIAISGTVYDQIENKVALDCESLGEHAVKNIARPVRVYRVPIGPGRSPRPGQTMNARGARPRRRALLVAFAVLVGLLAASGIAAWRLASRQSPGPVLPLPDKPSIAVLPFVNVDADPKQEHFSDGMTEEIITTLSKVSGLFVIASNSVFTYKGKPVKVQQVSRELGVRYVLEGSVRKSDPRLRVTAQLIDGTTGHHLWAERYDRELKDIFAIQDEIAQKIVTALAVMLTEGEQVRVRRRSTRSVEAWDHFTQAQERTRRGIPGGRASLEMAIAADPSFAAAYAWLSTHYTAEAQWGLSPSAKESLDRALEFAQKAVALDDSLADGYVALAWLYLVRRQHADAIAAAERALVVNPGHADAMATLAMVLDYSGRAEESIGLIETAMRLSPVYPPWYVRILGVSYGLTGRNEEALAAYEKYKQLASGGESWAPYLLIALTYVKMGREVEGQAAMAEAIKLNPKLTLERFARSQPYQNSAVADAIVDRARRAGLK